jgi:hypothetical protein
MSGPTTSKIGHSLRAFFELEELRMKQRKMFSAEYRGLLSIDVHGTSWKDTMSLTGCQM